jgi:hypothetical protein
MERIINKLNAKASNLRHSMAQDVARVWRKLAGIKNKHV